MCVAKVNNTLTCRHQLTPSRARRRLTFYVVCSVLLAGGGPWRDVVHASVLTSEEFGSQRDSTASSNPQLVLILLLIVTAPKGLTINMGGQRSGGFSASAR